MAKLFLGRKITWHWVHSFIGLWCSIILAFIFLTGTLAVVSSEIDWLLNDKLRVAADGREKLGLSAIYDGAQKALDGNEIYRVYRHDESYLADVVEYGAAGGNRLMWVDAYTGVAKGDGSIMTFSEVIGELHATLFIPTKAGIMVVSVFSLALTASLIAGIFLLPRFWRSFVTFPRFAGSTRAMASDFHRLIGAWSIPFVAVVSLTALYYFAETLNLDAPPIDRGVNTQPRDAKQPDDMSAAKIEAAIQAAHQVYPDMEVKHILLPRNRVQPIRIEGHLSATLVRERANSVYLHPETLALIRSHKGEDLSVHQRVSEAVDPLHWGYWGGNWSKALWFVFGLMFLSLPILGAIIFAKRMGVRRAKLEGEPISGKRVFWDGMGYGKWGAIGLVILGLSLMMKELI